MAYSPPPAKRATPTRILGPDGVPLSGDVTLTPGNNQTVTRVGNGFVVASTSPKRARALELFVPGALAARTLHVATGIPGAVLSAIDAFFKTAPGAGTDASNFAALRLTDGTTTVDFAFNVNGQGEYHLGSDQLSQVVGQHRSAVQTNAAPPDGGMLAIPFTPTANLTVGGVSWIACDSSYLTHFGTVRVGLCSVFDSTTGHTRGSTPWLTANDGATPAWVDIPASQMIPDTAAKNVFCGGFAIPPKTLLNGVTYMLTLMTTAAATVGDEGTYGNRTPTAQNGNAGGADTALNFGGYFVAGADLAGAGIGTAAQPWNRSQAQIGANTQPPFKLLGSVIGTAISLPVTASIVVTGAPANPGADLIASVQL